jgi:hypothetical protein
MFQQRKDTSAAHFNLYWMWKWFTAQVIVGKMVRQSYSGVEWNLDLIPQFQFAHNAYLVIGVGLSWFEYTVNFGIPTKSYYDNFKKQVTT